MGEAEIRAEIALAILPYQALPPPSLGNRMSASVYKSSPRGRKTANCSNDLTPFFVQNRIPL